LGLEKKNNHMMQLTDKIVHKMNDWKTFGIKEVLGYYDLGLFLARKYQSKEFFWEDSNLIEKSAY
jgi:hypothetical protein